MSLCPLCSAATLAPLIEGGVSIRKICERALRAVEDAGCDRATRAAVQRLADTANYLAAEATMNRNGPEPAKGE